MKVYPIFDRANRANRNKEGAIHVCVSDKGKRKYIHSGIKVLPMHWDERVWVVGRPDASVLNSIIKQIIDNCMLRGGLGSVTSFIEFAEQEVNNKGDSIRGAVAMFKRYGRMNSFKEATEDNARLFLKHMEQSKYSVYTIRLYISSLKKIAEEAKVQGYIRVNPFSRLILPKMIRKRAYLSEEEVKNIKEAYLENEKMCWARDCFIFQCYTGLSYVDVSNLNYATDVIHEEGKSYILGGRQKTKERYRIMLLPPALAILERYNYKLPLNKMSYQTYNNLCKLVGAYAGVKKKTTTHVARHTFATWALSKGLPIEIVSKMLAHTDIKTTQIYAKILQKDVDAGFDKLANAL